MAGAAAEDGDLSFRNIRRRHFFPCGKRTGGQGWAMVGGARGEVPGRSCRGLGGRQRKTVLFREFQCPEPKLWGNNPLTSRRC